MSRQFEAFREGFEEIFTLSTLQSFYPEEVQYLYLNWTFHVGDCLIQPLLAYIHVHPLKKFCIFFENCVSFISLIFPEDTIIS